VYETYLQNKNRTDGFIQFLVEPHHTRLVVPPEQYDSGAVKTDKIGDKKSYPVPAVTQEEHEKTNNEM
jgi:hypothetical protein